MKLFDWKFIAIACIIAIIVVCLLLFVKQMSDYIRILGILINALLAVWIVNVLQKKLANTRALKDYFIDETKSIKDAYKDKIKDIHTDNLNPQHQKAWFKQMNLDTQDLMNMLNSKYSTINESVLHPFQQELRELILNNPEFENAFKKNKKIIFSEDFKLKISRFEQKNSKLFNELIIKINDG